jgi:hypothetical protein
VSQAQFVDGQSTLPDIDLYCTPGQVNIEVSPGGTGTGTTYCTINNNSAYALDVDIVVTAVVLNHNAPDSVSVAAGSTVDFPLTLVSDLGVLTSQMSVNIEATVTSVNGIPPITEEKSEANILARLMQYGGVEVTSNQPQLKINSGETKELTYSVKNTGNGIDFIRLGIPYSMLDYLEDTGFIFAIDNVIKQIEVGQTSDFTISITAPYKEDVRNQLINWNENSNGDSELIIQFEVFAESEFSCRYGYGCVSDNAISLITTTDKSTDSFFSENSNLIYLGIGSISSILIAALLVFMLKNKSQKELTNPPIKSANPVIKNKVKPVSSIKELPPKDEFDFL